MFKKCKVVMLTTQKAEYPCIIKDDDMQRKRGLCWGNLSVNSYFTQDYLKSVPAKSYHLYILSDDKIEEGDWFYDFLYKVKQYNKTKKIIPASYSKKIIATTDTSLKIPGDDYDPRSKTGREWIFLPEPSQSFIKVFIEEYNKGNVITDVMVGYDEIKTAYQGVLNCLMVSPKDNTITIKKLKDSWSREEVIQLIRTFDIIKGRDITTKDFDKWIEENL